MAKEFDVSKAVAEFAKLGIKLTESQQAKLAEKLEKDFREAAEKSVSSKLITDDEKEKVSLSESWVVTLFDLAEKISSEIHGAKKNRGRGEVIEFSLGATGNEIETPNGSLKVILSQPVSE